MSELKVNRKDRGWWGEVISASIFLRQIELRGLLCVSQPALQLSKYPTVQVQHNIEELFTAAHIIFEYDILARPQ